MAARPAGRPLLALVVVALLAAAAAADPSPPQQQQQRSKKAAAAAAKSAAAATAAATAARGEPAFGGGEQPLAEEALALPAGSGTELVQVPAYALLQLPGCKVPGSDGMLLPAGLLEDSCVVEMQLKQDDPQVFTFAVPEGAPEMSALLTLDVAGGDASMSLWLPGSPVDGPPDFVQGELFTSPASSEGFISLPHQVLRSAPGQYLLSVTAFSGRPAARLTVQTPPASLQLDEGERAALAAAAAACCADEEAKGGPFCSVIAPQSLSPGRDWAADLCHLAPSGCTAAGRLSRLALPGLGLRCPGFPQQLAGLSALTRLDLSGNSLGAAPLDDVAAVVSSLPLLEELALGSTGLSGTLPCSIATPSLKVLDLAYNFLEGPLPPCLLASLSELYVPGNALSGPLPAPPPPLAAAPLATLYANAQRGGGLTGTIPVSYGSLRRLSFLNLGGNSLSGALPGLPPSLKLLNVSDNRLTGRLGALPPAAWSVDVGGNGLEGPLPARLAQYGDLEVLVASNNPLGGQLGDLPPGLTQLELANASLSGRLPPLPPALRRLDLSDNQLVGPAAAVNATGMEVLRAANNRLGGPLPPTAATSPLLFLLDLSGNELAGPLPERWDAPRMQMVMLEGNALTGTVPPSLAALPRLGVLRLGTNRLNGTLEPFASALADPAAAAAAAAPASRLFDFNVSNNRLSGPVPRRLGLLGVFNPALTFMVPGPGGEAAVAPRALDLSGNALEGPWPTWAVDAVANASAECDCGVTLALGGEAMRLACPPDDVNVTDLGWQRAARARHRCWDAAAGRAEQLLDFLYSPANSADRIDDPDALPPPRGDGGAAAAAPGAAPGAPRGMAPGAMAGVVLGVLGGLGLLAAAAYFVVYRRLVAPRAAATQFSKFRDEDPLAAAAARGPAARGPAAAAAVAGGARAAAPL